MKNSIKAAVVLVGMTLSTPGFAAGQAFVCELLAQGTGGFIPSDMYIKVDEKIGTAVVYDGAIKEMHGKPIAVKAKTVSTLKYLIKWELFLQSSNAGKLKVKYTLRFDQGRQFYSIQAAVAGFDNNANGQGRCKPVT